MNQLQLQYKNEDGESLVVRMYDAEGKVAKVILDSHLKLGNLKHTNIIEENPKTVDEIDISPYGIETCRLDLDLSYE